MISGIWVVSDTLGGAGGWLNNITQSASVPTSGWQHADGKGGWLRDPALTVTPLSALSSVTCSFTPTGDFSCGGQVFSSGRGRYL